jgi:hypothetical protein
MRASAAPPYQQQVRVSLAVEDAMQQYEHLDSFHDLAERISEEFTNPAMTRDDLVQILLADKSVTNHVTWWLTQYYFGGIGPLVDEIPAKLLKPIVRLLITGMAAQYELDTGKVPAIEAVVIARNKADSEFAMASKK